MNGYIKFIRNNLSKGYKSCICPPSNFTCEIRLDMSIFFKLHLWNHSGYIFPSSSNFTYEIR